MVGRQHAFCYRWVNTSSSTQERYLHSEERQEGDELGKLANDLRQAICDVMDEPRTVAEMLPFFAQQAESEKVTYAQFESWKKALRKSEYADELVLALTAKELGLCIAVVPKMSDWVIRWHPPREGLSVQDSVIYLGNDDLHYVCLKVTPLVDRTQASTGSGNGQGLEDADATSKHGSGCSGTQMLSSQKACTERCEVEGRVLQTAEAGHLIDLTGEEEMDARPMSPDGCGHKPARTQEKNEHKRSLEEVDGDGSLESMKQGVQEVKARHGTGLLKRYKGSQGDRPAAGMQLPSSNEAVPDRWVPLEEDFEVHRISQADRPAAGAQLPSSNEAIPDSWVALEEDFNRLSRNIDLKSLYRKTLPKKREAAFTRLVAAVQKANLRAVDGEFPEAQMTLTGAVNDVLASCVAP